MACTGTLLIQLMSICDSSRHHSYFIVAHRSKAHCCPAIKSLPQTFFWFSKLRISKCEQQQLHWNHYFILSYSCLESGSDVNPLICRSKQSNFKWTITSGISHISHLQITKFSPPPGVLLRAGENLKVDLWTRPWHPPITLQPFALIDFDVSGEQPGRANPEKPWIPRTNF